MEEPDLGVMAVRLTRPLSNNLTVFNLIRRAIYSFAISAIIAFVTSIWRRELFQRGAAPARPRYPRRPSTGKRLLYLALARWISMRRGRSGWRCARAMPFIALIRNRCGSGERAA